MTARRLMILGGSSGIGLSTFKFLRESKAFTHILSFGEEDFDVTDFNALVREMRYLNPTDLLYSVGINRLDWILNATAEDFARVMEVNVWGLLNAIKALDFTSGGEARNVVAVTSDAAWRPMRTSAIYCASKSAMEMAVRVASREYAPKGWRVNAVAPGKVDETPMTEYVDEKVLELRGWTPKRAEEYELASTPLGRKVTKLEVAEVIARVMFGPAAQTGEIIAVNGGR